MATDNEVLQENIPVIVDCDVLEAAKENVQPLAAGRRVTALSAILSTPHAQREAKLSATRTRLRINVEVALDDEDDDPLEAYCRLVYWTVENYPQGHSAESGLLELIEEATRVLKDDRGGVWRTDLRYLKLWVLYASYVERPVVIYKFLLANDIGTPFALFYEEYATILEREGQYVSGSGTWLCGTDLYGLYRRSAADEIYILGTARQATPIDRLQSRHREFQKRMMCSAPLPGAPPPISTSVATTRRTVLGASPAIHTAAPLLSTRSPRHHNDDVFSGPSQSTPNARMQIFVDPSGSESQNREGNAWPELGGRKTRIKENVPESKKMDGTKLRQAGKSKRIASAKGSKIVPYRDSGVDSGDVMPPPPVPADDSALKTPSKAGIVPSRDDADNAVGVSSTPKFMPFRDEEGMEVTITPSGSSSSVPDSALKVKKGVGIKGVSMTEAEALRKDPLKNYEE
jgi:spindle assembly checkpoint component MAD3